MLNMFHLHLKASYQIQINRPMEGLISIPREYYRIVILHLKSIQKRKWTPTVILI